MSKAIEINSAKALKIDKKNKNLISFFLSLLMCELTFLNTVNDGILIFFILVLTILFGLIINDVYLYNKANYNSRPHIYY
jgi:hypothetical protein